MYCPNCGSQLNENICERCSIQIGNNVNESDNNIGWGILGFFVPLAGLIIYLTMIETRPKAAKMAGKGALIKVIASVVFIIFLLIFFFIFAYTNEVTPSSPYDYLFIVK